MESFLLFFSEVVRSIYFLKNKHKYLHDVLFYMSHYFMLSICCFMILLKYLVMILLYETTY